MPLYVPLRDPGLFALYAILTPETPHAEVESVIVAEYERLKRGGVRSAELARAKARFAAATALQRDGAHALATVLNESIAVGDWTLALTIEGRIQETGADDIARVAERYLRPESSTVGWFVPKRVQETIEAQEGAPPSVHEPLHER